MHGRSSRFAWPGAVGARSADRRRGLGLAQGGGQFAGAAERADAADPGEAFFGFLARIAAEAIAKRDLPDAISIAGSLREDPFTAIDLLLRRAQQAGAVRDGIKTSDLIVLLKGMFAGLAGSTDPALHERVFAVLADGLRPPRPQA